MSTSIRRGATFGYPMNTSRENTGSSTPPAAERFTLPWALEEYGNYQRTTRHISESYVQGNRTILRRFFRYLDNQGTADVRKITRRHVETFQEAYLESPLQPMSKRYSLYALGAFLRWLYEFGYTDEELNLAIDPPRKSTHLPRPILGKEEIQFLVSLPNPKDLYELQDLCLLRLLFASGMRPEEACELALEDVDLKRQNPQAIVRRPKNKMDRVVAIDPYTAGLLEKFIQTARPWIAKGKSTNRLFLSTVGTPLTREVFDWRFARRYGPAFKKKFGKSIGLYSLRHSSATHWMEEGFRHHQDILPCVQRQLGHRDLNSTSVYTHVSIEPLRQMLRRYHPRELAYASLGKIPESPKDLPQG